MLIVTIGEGTMQCFFFMLTYLFDSRRDNGQGRQMEATF